MASSSSFPSHPSYAMVNIKDLMPVQLSSTNYLVWKTLFITILERFNLLGHVNGSSICPSSTITTKDDQEEPNPLYSQWLQDDTTVLSWINDTLSMDILKYILFSSSTAQDAWLAIQKLFLGEATSIHLQLMLQIQRLKKASFPMTIYLQRLKIIADSLYAIGHPISDPDLVLYALSGLSFKYESFVTAVMTRPSLPSFAEICPLLLNLEFFLQPLHRSFESEQSPAFFSSCGRGRGRGNSQKFWRAQSPPQPDSLNSGIEVKGSQNAGGSIENVVHDSRGAQQRNSNIGVRIGENQVQSSRGRSVQLVSDPAGHLLRLKQRTRFKARFGQSVRLVSDPTGFRSRGNKENKSANALLLCASKKWLVWKQQKSLKDLLLASLEGYQERK